MEETLDSLRKEKRDLLTTIAGAQKRLVGVNVRIRELVEEVVRELNDEGLDIEIDDGSNGNDTKNRKSTPRAPHGTSDYIVASYLIEKGCPLTITSEEMRTFLDAGNDRKRRKLAFACLGNSTLVRKGSSVGLFVIAVGVTPSVLQEKVTEFEKLHKLTVPLLVEKYYGKKAEGGEESGADDGREAHDPHFAQA